MPSRQSFIDAGDYVGLRRIEEAQRIVQLNFPVRIEIQQLAQTEQGSIAVRLGDKQGLLFVLQFDVGAKRVDAGADAFFLQIGGLVIESLREIDARSAASTVAIARNVPIYCETTSRITCSRVERLFSLLAFAPALAER